jgi:hypothetical protein
MHIMAGSAIFISIFVVHLRKRTFEKRFGTLLKAQSEQVREHRRSLSAYRGQPGFALPTIEQGANNQRIIQDSLTNDRHDLCTGSSGDMSNEDGNKIKDSGNAGPSPSTETAPSPRNEKVGDAKQNDAREDHIAFDPNIVYSPGNRHNLQHRRSEVFSFTGVGASAVKTTSFRRPGQGIFTSRNSAVAGADLEFGHAKTDSWHNHHFLTKDVVGRNSQFHGLTREERESLGGTEYRAISLLSWIVPIYFALWQLLGCLGIGAWMAYNAADVTESNGINPWHVSLDESIDAKY